MARECCKDSRAFCLQRASNTSEVDMGKSKVYDEKDLQEQMVFYMRRKEIMKRILTILLAGAVVLTVAGCSSNKDETEAAADNQTQTQAQSQAQTQSSTETTLSGTTLDGTVVDADSTTMVVMDDDGNEYTVMYADANLDLDANGLYDGISVSVTLESATSSGGVFTATDVEETYDPMEDTEAAD